MQKFIGMGKRESQNYADSLNFVYRLCRVDGEQFFSYPAEEEKRNDRICIEIENGKVVKATVA